MIKQGAIGCNSWRRLVGEFEAEFLQEYFLIFFRLGVAAENEGASVGGGEVGVDHLDGGKLIQNGSGGQPGCVSPQAGSQGDMQAISQESDEDMGLDPVLALMVDGTQVQVVLDGFEGSFDFGKLDVEAPQLGGVASAEIGAQQVAAFAAVRGAQFGPVKPETEGGRGA